MTDGVWLGAQGQVSRDSVPGSEAQQVGGQRIEVSLFGKECWRPPSVGKLAGTSEHGIEHGRFVAWTRQALGLRRSRARLADGQIRLAIGRSGITSCIGIVWAIGGVTWLARMLCEFCCERFLSQGWHGVRAAFTSALPGIGMATCPGLRQD